MQSDADVFTATSGARGRSECATDLAVRRPDLRLVQKRNEARLSGRGRSGRAIGPGDLHVLQEIRYPDRSDGREFPQHGPDSRASWVRLPND